LHDALLNYGTPVQYSVFECLVAEKELARLKKQVRRIIKPRLDHVRYYYLCGACVKRVESTMGPELPGQRQNDAALDWGLGRFDREVGRWYNGEQSGH